MTAINLTQNLREKMEYVISQFIEELYNTENRERLEDYYYSERLPFDAFIRNILFDLVVFKHLFDQISNNYFDENDRKQLQQYYTPDPRARITIEMYLRDYIFIIARRFAMQNHSFIKNILDSFNNLPPILK
jgi:hypothetical protein